MVKQNVNLNGFWNNPQVGLDLYRIRRSLDPEMEKSSHRIF